jgi:hypothetical protein
MADEIKEAPEDAAAMVATPYISAIDLPDKGAIVIIRDVKEITLNGNAVVKTASTKALLYVTNAKGVEMKPFIANKTNLRTIIKLYGRKWRQDWLGKPIRIYPTTCIVSGNETACVRVRNEIPVLTSAKPAAPQPSLMDDGGAP